MTMLKNVFVFFCFKINYNWVISTKVQCYTTYDLKNKIRVKRLNRGVLNRPINVDVLRLSMFLVRDTCFRKSSMSASVSGFLLNFATRTKQSTAALTSFIEMSQSALSSTRKYSNGTTITGNDVTRRNVFQSPTPTAIHGDIIDPMQ